jgi:hypothetical protein
VAEFGGREAIILEDRWIDLEADVARGVRGGKEWHGQQVVEYRSHFARARSCARKRASHSARILSASATVEAGTRMLPTSTMPGLSSMPNS